MGGVRWVLTQCTVSAALRSREKLDRELQEGSNNIKPNAWTVVVESNVYY